MPAIRKPTRNEFIRFQRKLLGAPYVWGGKSYAFGRQSDANGLDCSGFETFSLHELGGPDLRQTHNAAKLCAELPPTSAPKSGDLAFYGEPNRITHVVTLVGLAADGQWSIMGSNGGDERCTTAAIAKTINACVKTRMTHLYRRDFREFRSMSQFLEE